MLILHDANFVRYGIEPIASRGNLSGALPRGRPPKDLAPLKKFNLTHIHEEVKESFLVCEVSPEGKYEIFLDLTSSPHEVYWKVYPEHRNASTLAWPTERTIVRIRQFVQVYPPLRADAINGYDRCKGSTFHVDTGIVARKILKEILIDLEVRGIWHLLDKNNVAPFPLPDDIVRKKREAPIGWLVQQLEYNRERLYNAISYSSRKLVDWDSFSLPLDNRIEGRGAGKPHWYWKVPRGVSLHEVSAEELFHLVA